MNLKISLLFNIIFCVTNLILLLLVFILYSNIKENSLRNNEQYFYKKLSALVDRKLEIDKGSYKKIQFALKDITDFQWHKACFIDNTSVLFNSGFWKIIFYDHHNNKINNIRILRKDIYIPDNYVASSPLKEKTPGLAAGCYDNEAEFILTLSFFRKMSPFFGLYSLNNFKEPY